MPEHPTPYGISTTVDLPYDVVVERAREALRAEGFGILTEIDVRTTLKEKLDVDFRPYIIFGACIPSLAHEALTAEKDIGLLLPCNVIVYAADEPGRSVVAALDPVTTLALSGNDALRPLATDVQSRLERVLTSLARA